MFLGWYDNYDAAAGTGTLVSTEQTYYLNTATRHLNLTPVYEPTAYYRDHYNVWFDGSLGIIAQPVKADDIGHGNNTIYSSFGSDKVIHGAKPELVTVNKAVNSNQAVTFNTPSTAVLPLGSECNYFRLQGWFMLPAPGGVPDVSAASYVKAGDPVTISRDTVFYADWFPDNYNIGQASEVFEPTGTIVYPDTSNFITTDMFDYNTLFNMESIKLDDDSHMNALGNYEYWSRYSSGTRDFTFVTALSHEIRAVSPRYRKVDWRNQSHELSREGDIYAGYIYPGIMSTPGLRDDLFGRSDALGKRYAGRGDNLYLYDTATGYYYYDSDKNAASFNAGDHRFYVYKYTNGTNKSFVQGGNDHRDFLPFNYGRANYSFEDTNWFTEASGEPNYWFGMKSEIQFFLPNTAGYQDGNGYGNRSVKGDDMVFKFSGDDDVWVYVDDELYLDMGGIHGKVYGEINFSQGTRTVVSAGATKVNDAKGIMSYEPGTGTIETEKFTLPEGDHKVTIYYLERGSSQSNCAIYFNLAPRYTLQFHKVDSDTDDNIQSPVTFGVFTDPDCTVPAQLKDLWGNTTHLFTAMDGWKHATGLLAGHTYYIKEISAPKDYPDVSSEVITLKIKTDGTAEVSSTADVAGDSGWRMTEVTSSEAENSTNKGTFKIGLKVKNRKNTSISARKIWGMLDGNVETHGGRHAEVRVKLQRYSLMQTTNDQNGIHYTVTVVPRFFASNGKPTNRDDGTLVRLGEPLTVSVPRDGSVTFTASANGEHAGIHSIIGPNMSFDNLTNTTEKFFINSSWETAMKSGDYTAAHIRQDTAIYVNFIGSGESVSDLNAVISTLTAQNAQGDVTYSKQPDAAFNALTTYNDQALEQTLSPANNWTCTWDNLPVSENGTAYYYYVEEVPVEHQLAENETLDLNNTVPAYVAAYSSDGLSGGGTIAVRNNVKANKIRLRKRDDDPKKNALSGAQFQIYLASEYEKADGKPLTVRDNSQWMDEETYDTEAHAFVSNSEGKFFSGYLPKGTYYLVETKAPEGYAKVDGAIKVVVDEKGMLYQLPGSENLVRAPLGSDGYYSLYIVDPKVEPVDITIAKVIKGTSTPLTGATFTLTRVDSNNNVITGTDAVEKTVTVVSDGENMGKAIFTGMTYGRYRLEETVVPDGYVKVEGPYYITIDAKGNHSLDDTVAHNLILKDGNVYTIENEPGVRLPSTGGPGTTFFYVFGSLLTLLAAALLLRRKHDC